MAEASDPVQLPELGVGVTYMPALHPLFASHTDLIDVIEVEPQVFWLETNAAGSKYRTMDGVFEAIATLPFLKLVHSVGVPVGGSVRPQQQILELLAQNIRMLKSPWVSDHLSFNATPAFHTGFFLPPRQTAAGLATAIVAVGEIRRACGVPVAIETGVNYLKPRPDEIADGLFVAEVANKSDCGILLDLHNLYCNQANGRQSIEDFLAQIPLNRVWEVHLAGGLELDGYWLDAHSGSIPSSLITLCREVFPRLPNLKAVIFEIFPSFVAEVGIETVRRELELLRELWELRGRQPVTSIGHAVAPAGQIAARNAPTTPQEWEETLGSLVLGRESGNTFSVEIANDPGIALMRNLIHEFRGSMIVGVLRLTSRLLMLTLGPDVFTTILRDFWSKSPPRQFASSEADAFADYLTSINLAVPHLAKVLEFERQAIASLVNDETRIVCFDFDPLPLLRALAEGHLPDSPGSTGKFEIKLTSAQPIASVGLDIDSVRGAYPFH